MRLKNWMGWAALGVGLSMDTATAIPMLQLDIAGGVYDPVSQTVETSNPKFDLVALLNLDSKAKNQGYTLGGITSSTTVTHPNTTTTVKNGSTTTTTKITEVDTIVEKTVGYYISAALLPSTSAGGDFGSFTFDGQNVLVTSGMSYGTPGSLPPHEVFPTYYKVFGSFTFPNVTVPVYDVAAKNNSLDDSSDDSSGVLYEKVFNVDLTGLEIGRTMHFDLFGTLKTTTTEITTEQITTATTTTTGSGRNKKTTTTTTVGAPTSFEVTKTKDGFVFAPFSHDAESSRVPDGASTFSLLGMALAGLGAFSRKSART